MTEAIPEDLKEFCHEKMLSDEMCLKFVKLARQGDEYAIERLMRFLMRFIAPISIGTIRESSNPELNWRDFIDIARQSLIRAVQTYDETSGERFIIHAVTLINRSLTDAITEQSNKGL